MSATIAADLELMMTPAPFTLVDDATFAAAVDTARATRTHRFVLWHLAQPCYDSSDDAPWRWDRIGSAATREAHHRIIEKTERFGDRYAWLITEEHHDVAGGIYRTDGTILEHTWQPTGPGFLRTAANPHTWIPIRSLIPWNFCATIAISDAPAPAATDYPQPRRALYAPESDVFVHFTEREGPYTGRPGCHADVDNKFLAPRVISERMSAFLGGKTTASMSEVTTTVVRYIQRNHLQSGMYQTITSDPTLLSITGKESFRLVELQTLLKPHYGALIGSE